ARVRRRPARTHLQPRPRHLPRRERGPGARVGGPRARGEPAMTRRALMLIAFGGPHRSEDVRPFLRNVLAGRPIPEARFEAVVQHYELLGGRSPITEHTEAQARALSAELAR